MPENRLEIFCGGNSMRIEKDVKLTRRKCLE